MLGHYRLPVLSNPQLSRVPTGGLLCAVALLAGLALAWLEAPTGSAKAASKPQQPGDASKATESVQRIREGEELVDQLGGFRTVGDRLMFVAADGAQLIALENLNLERISRALEESPDRLEWAVSGTITEYRGMNFLIIRRAMLKSRPRPPGEAYSSPPAVQP